MRYTPFRRKVALLLLGTVLATPWAAVAGPRPDSPRREAAAPAVSGLLEPLWRLLLGAWADRGCDIDPSGACTSDPATGPAPALETERGCDIDPDGACRS